MDTTPTGLTTCRELLEREIARFRDYARLRCDVDRRRFRRRHLRYQRSWPLLVAALEDGVLLEYSAALHDAADGGIAFVSKQPFDMDQMVFIRLFWHDAEALRIPARVRHATPITGGILTGTEYALGDLEACELALQLERLGSDGPSDPPPEHAPITSWALLDQPSD